MAKTEELKGQDPNSTPPEQTPEASTTGASDSTPGPTGNAEGSAVLEPLLELLRKEAKDGEAPLDVHKRLIAETKAKAEKPSTKGGKGDTYVLELVRSDGQGNDRFAGSSPDGREWKFEEVMSALGLGGWNQDNLRSNLASMTGGVVSLVGDEGVNLPHWQTNSTIKLVVTISSPEIDA